MGRPNNSIARSRCRSRDRLLRRTAWVGQKNFSCTRPFAPRLARQARTTKNAAPTVIAESDDIECWERVDFPVHRRNDHVPIRSGRFTFPWLRPGSRQGTTEQPLRTALEPPSSRIRRPAPTRSKPSEQPARQPEASDRKLKAATSLNHRVISSTGSRCLRLVWCGCCRFHSLEVDRADHRHRERVARPSRVCMREYFVHPPFFGVFPPEPPPPPPLRIPLPHEASTS